MNVKLGYEELAKHPSTALQRRDQALTVLGGIISGIDADGEIRSEEVDYLTHWLAEHQRTSRGVDMADLQQMILNALAEKKLTASDHEEITDAIERLRSPGFYNGVTHAIQSLHGLLAGIACDGEITVAEIDKVQEWLGEHQEIREFYPIAEIDSLITSVMADGEITQDEQRILLDFCGQWVAIGEHRVLQSGDVGHNHIFTGGITAVAPEIAFPGKKFCVTGASSKATRGEMQEIISARGGLISTSVIKDLDYLIYCSQGSSCWAYSCYGRKVEQAIAYRKSGSKMLIVAEIDFWDSLR